MQNIPSKIREQRPGLPAGWILEYIEFLESGIPVLFDVPGSGQPVISAFGLDDRLLVKRTDFTADSDPVSLVFDQVSVSVMRRDGACQIINLPQDRGGVP